MPFDSVNFEKPEVVRQLEAAKALIADPTNWCQGTMAMSRHRWPIGISDPQASAWCSEGAIVRITGAVSEKGNLWRFLRSASHELGYFAPFELNDNTNHATVMRMFDRAIELAWEREKV